MKKTIINVTSWSQFFKSQCVNEMMLWKKIMSVSWKEKFSIFNDATNR